MEKFKLHKIIKLLLIFGVIAGNLFAAVKFSGRITDLDGEPLIGVNVMLKESMIGAATDEGGNFIIEAPEGQFTLLITHIGFEQIEEKINFRFGENVIQNYQLQIKYFEIGGIRVYADNKLLTNEAETKTTVTAGEIEHIQATSLSDVMKLVPGQRFENPGLQDKKQVSLRQSSTGSVADDNASMGTQIILDNIPISNNANMQIDTKVNTGTIDRTTTNEGIDLRQIPADNIEKLEIIRGIPSAKYGDLTSGIIKVETKSTSLDQRLKYKYNLRNQEANLNGGVKLFEQFFNYNFNYANSIRDIRVDDYDYSRIAGQLSHTLSLFKNLYTVKNKFYYTRTFDEQGLRKGDLTLSERYNRDYILRYTHDGTWLLSPKQKLEVVYSINYNRQNSYNKQLLTGDNTYLTDRMTEGVQEGYFFKTDTSELWVKGRALNQYINLEYINSFLVGGLQNNITGGLTFRHESNRGKGRIFDPMTPPSITSAFRDRPRSYDDIPALLISSFYLEDKIKGEWLKKFQLSIGLRIESYGKESGPFSDDHGMFINPRLNMLIYVSDNSQLRIGYGSTSKAPPLSMLYPNSLYYDVADINRYTQVDSTRLAVVSTHIFSRENPNLEGSRQTKKEISFHQKIGKLGFSATGYQNHSEKGFSSSLVKPIFLYKYDYPNWTPGNPNMNGMAINDSVSTLYSIYENSHETKSGGIEFSLQTAPLTPMSVKFRLEAAYNKTRSESKAFDYASTYLVDNSSGKEVLPFWNPVNIETENLLINYRMEFQIKKLGAWVTLESQQVVFDKDRNLGYQDSLAVGYFTDQGEKVLFSEFERTGTLPSTYKRNYPDYWGIEENQTQIWLFNLRVSKSITKGSEVSFFVNNFFDSRPLYRRQRVSEGTKSYTRLNPELFFGIEFSGVINDLF
ncbi:MAG: TonB-dependent receptor [Candidatus Marinimicrobia bacterium]|nr:TonB-dependent receptor [Candidatus Neomarinimicrobiota bacterium]